MAQASALKTYDVTTNLRDVTDLISVVARTETPFYSGLQKVQAIGRFHETQQYELTTGNQDNALIEGQDYSFTLATAPETVGNWTQIFFKQAKVSKTQQAVQTYGVDDMLAQQLEWRMKEIATDVEKAYLQGTGNSGASGTARKVKGALEFITTNVNTGTGTGTQALTSAVLNDTLQDIWDAGGRPKNILVNSFQKRQISAMTDSNTKNVEASAQTIYNSVDVYVSDFGMLQVDLDSFMPTDEVFIYQKELWENAVLRPIVVNDYPQDLGSFVAKTVEGEMTLGSRNQKGNGLIIKLTTS